MKCRLDVRADIADQVREDLGATGRVIDNGTPTFELNHLGRTDYKNTIQAVAKINEEYGSKVVKLTNDPPLATIEIPDNLVEEYYQAGVLQEFGGKSVSDEALEEQEEKDYQDWESTTEFKGRVASGNVTDTLKNIEGQRFHTRSAVLAYLKAASNPYFYKLVQKTDAEGSYWNAILNPRYERFIDEINKYESCS